MSVAVRQAEPAPQKSTLWTMGKPAGGRRGSVTAISVNDLNNLGGFTTNPKRLSSAQKTAKNKERMKVLFRKHDIDDSRQLDHGELKALLMEYSSKADISTEEVSFVLRMGDTVRVDGEIDRNEIASAIAAWDVLNEDIAGWDSTFHGTKHDTHQEGHTDGLDKEQLGVFLRGLNGPDGDVSPEEIDWVWRRADVDKSGAIDHDELRIAVALWYTKVNFDYAKVAKKSYFCCGR
jgi:Ca2+-binding EF-hand superfamily protein